MTRDLCHELASSKVLQEEDSVCFINLDTKLIVRRSRLVAAVLSSPHCPSSSSSFDTFQIGDKASFDNNEFTANIHKMSKILLGLSTQDVSEDIGHEVCSLFRNHELYITAIRNRNISGEKILWSIILESDDDAVAEMCIRYMAVLYTFVDDESRINHWWPREQVLFIRSCMSELTTKHEHASIQRKKKRMVLLVKEFVQIAMRDSATSTMRLSSSFSHGHLSDVVGSVQTDDMVISFPSFDVNIHVIDNESQWKGKRFTLTCSLGGKTPVSYLRAAIHREFPMLPSVKSEERTPILVSNLRLLFNGSELIDDAAELREFGIIEDSMIY